LTDKSLFDYWITDPLRSGKPDSLRRLQELVKATCLRRTKKAICHTLTLPQRVEKIETVDFHQEDRDIYNFFRERASAIAARISSQDGVAANSNQSKGINILSLINFLRLICNHGSKLLPQSAIQAWESRDRASVDWQIMRKWKTKCDICDCDIEGTDTSVAPIKSSRDCEHSICSVCAIQSQNNLIEDDMNCPTCIQMAPDSENPISLDSQTAFVRPSPKIEALMRNLLREQRHTDDFGSVIVTKRYVLQIKSFLA
jgi:SNF2 family DNA or RNA helicase